MLVGIKEVKNPLEMLSIIMAFDSRDWFMNKRDRMLYAIVQGLDGIPNDELYQYGWTDETINEFKDFHFSFMELWKKFDEVE